MNIKRLAIMIVALAFAFGCMGVIAAANQPDISVTANDKGDGYVIASENGVEAGNMTLLSMRVYRGTVEEANSDLASIATDENTLAAETIEVGPEGFVQDFKMNSPCTGVVVLYGKSGSNEYLDESPYILPEQLVGVPETITAVSSGYAAINIQWSEVSGATYALYRADAEGAAPMLIADGLTEPKYLDGDIVTGQTYYYSVQAVVGDAVGSFTKTVAANSVLDKPVIKSITAGKKKLTLKWAKVSGADGYIIARSLKKNSGYKNVKTIASGVTTSFANTGLKAKKTYYYKVTAYKYVNDQQVLSPASAVKSKKTK